MDIPPEVLELAGAIALAVPLTARAIPRAINTVSTALAARTKAKADAEVKLAEAKKLEADAQKADADAELARAAADRVQAESAAAMLSDLQHRLEVTEAKNAECERRNDKLEQDLVHMRRQIEADAEVIAKFSERTTEQEKRIEAMRAETKELRRIMRAGGLDA